MQFSQLEESVFSNHTVLAKDFKSDLSNQQVRQWIQKNNSSGSISDTKYKPLVMVGPSGAGKGTLIKVLTEKYIDKFGFSVSYTTRAPRAGEEHGKNYFFVTREVFQEMIVQDAFIEYCEVHKNFYGTAKSQIRSIQQKNQIPLLDIDVQGAIKFQKVFPDSNFVSVLPPSVEELRKRLIARNTESEASLATRLKNAPEELQQLLSMKDIFSYRIVNDDLSLSTSIFSRLIAAFYEDELGSAKDVQVQEQNEQKEVGKSQVQKVEKSYWSYAIGPVAFILGLVVVHEVVRNRKKFFN